MPTPEVSVVIASHNGAARIGLQLEALATQSDAPHFEVIVVDNGSTDGLREAALSWVDRLPGLRVIQAKGHQGTSYARNVGIAAARSDKIAFCDDDDCVGARWVDAASRSLNAAEFVTGAVTDLDAHSFSSVAAVRALVPEPATFKAPHDEAGFDVYPVLMGGNSALRKPVALRLGGFDQRFFPGAEDNDLALRHVAAGGELLRAPSMVVAARTRPTVAGAARRAFDAGRMHMRLCRVHDLWSVSPALHDPDFRVDLLRAIAAAARDHLGRRRDARGSATRIALRAGQVLGWVESGLLRRIPPQRTRLGLEGLDAE